MTSQWWQVTLHHRDSGTYPRIIVSGATEDDAITQACNIELAPRRSVVKVETYDIGKDDMMSEHEMTCEWVDWDNPEVCGCIDCCAVCGGNQ